MIRTRFAPSPTGYLHIGGLRSCLFAYLFAKQNQGHCILRIEDTDQTRFVHGAAEQLILTFQKLGLHFDEGPTYQEGQPIPPNDSTLSHLQQNGQYGPYIQSQRTEIYRQHAKQLVESGHAYYCFATAEELEQMRSEQQAAGLPTIYDRRALQLTPQQVQQKLRQGLPHVIRLKIPRDRTIQFRDHVRGKVTFHGSQIDDQILIKSDGLPTYHLANVVDDHLMQISHVIRGEEWLPSTPTHIILYQAFGWPIPEFAHLPLILNQDKSKLSKRQNDVSVESYLQKGYIIPALLNFVALLGWHPGKGNEQEIFSLQELIEQFSLQKVNKAGAVFNLEKLDWFNQNWRKKLFYQQLDQIAKSIDPLVSIQSDKREQKFYTFTDTSLRQQFQNQRINLLEQQIQPFINQDLQRHPGYSRALLANEEKIVREPQQINQLIDYLFNPPPLDQNLLINPKMGIETLQDAQTNLRFAHQILQQMDNFDDLESIKNHLIEAIQSSQYKNGQILWPLRAALTHQQFSIGAFESAWVIGKTETLKRLDEIIS